jgi:hypothetical protein
MEFVQSIYRGGAKPRGRGRIDSESAEHGNRGGIWNTPSTDAHHSNVPLVQRRHVAFHQFKHC